MELIASYKCYSRYESRLCTEYDDDRQILCCIVNDQSDELTIHIVVTMMEPMQKDDDETGAGTKVTGRIKNLQVIRPFRLVPQAGLCSKHCSLWAQTQREYSPFN